MKGTVIIPGFGPLRRAALDQARKAESLLGEGFEALAPEGRNVAEARNRGIDAARGAWIFWADADDEIGGPWARLVRRTAEEETAGVAVWGMETVTARGRRRAAPASDETVPAALALRDCLSGRTGSYLHSAGSRASLWRGLRFDPSLATMEDFILVPHLLARAAEVHRIPEAPYGYVQREGSLTRGDARAVARAVLPAAARREAEWRGTRFAADASMGAADAVMTLWESLAAQGARDEAREARSFLAERKRLLAAAGWGAKRRLRLLLALLGARRARGLISRTCAPFRGSTRVSS